VILPAVDRELAERARRSFSAFVAEAWPLVEPTRPYLSTWHGDAICDHLEAVTRGEIRRLIITVPPGTAKSLRVSVLWPAWLWAIDPSWRTLFASYADQLAEQHSGKCRRVIESEWYRTHYSGPAGWSLEHDQNRLHDFANTRTGVRFCTGVGGGATGNRGDVIVIDDPLKAQDAYSKSAREGAIEWFTGTMTSRLNDLTTGRIVIIMQRLHEEDLAGHLLRAGGYEHLCLPSEFDPDRRAVTYHDLGGERRAFWRDPREEPGALLFPEMFPRSVLDEAKSPRGMGVDMYAAQHQQSPTPAGGNMFKRSDWRFWKPDGVSTADAAGMAAQRPRGCYEGPALPRPAKLDRVLISVDGTFKRTERGSYVAIHVWGISGARRLLLDRVHERMDYDECERALLAVIARWPEAREKVVEDKANGSAIVNRLTDVLKIPGVVAEPSGTDSKEQRAAVHFLPCQRAGNVELPDGAPWIGEFIAEHDAFPLGRTNDDVDAGSQAMRRFEQPAVYDYVGALSRLRR
jgi:predicted phage terminase large subunit-like protein